MIGLDSTALQTEVEVRSVGMRFWEAAVTVESEAGCRKLCGVCCERRVGETSIWMRCARGWVCY